MTKEQFEKEYEANIMGLKYKDFFITLPCNCGERDCPKWAAVTNSPLAIKAHNDLYNK
jgi:hypothetical protein